jgi:hypothetical protein
MKKTLFYAALLSCSIFGCKKKEESSQAGVYKLDKQMVTGGARDSVYGRTQIKIYTDRYFMYAGMAPDSSVGFGIGSYSIDKSNNITERNIYSSALLDSPRTYKLKIIKKDSAYSQVIPALAIIKGIKYDLKEDYVKLPSGDTSMLDGLWKMEKNYMVKGKDTTMEKTTQYKIFWGGHFIFIHRYPVDAAKTKFKNGFGAGEFSFRNDTLREEDQMTNHPVLLNQKFAIKISFNGNDEYKQVINNSKTNEQSVEVYRRIT